MFDPTCLDCQIPVSFPDQFGHTTVVALSILEVHDEWHRPWAAYAIGYPVLLVFQGLGWSYDVHRRREP